MANHQHSFRSDPCLLLLAAAVYRLVRRLANGGRLADVVLHDVHFLVLIVSVIWNRRFPPGSAARWWASFASLLATSSITLAIVWISVGSPTPEEAVIWVVWGFAAFCVLFLVCFFFFINSTATTARGSDRL